MWSRVPGRSRRGGACSVVEDVRICTFLLRFDTISVLVEDVSVHTTQWSVANRGKQAVAFTFDPFLGRRGSVVDEGRIAMNEQRQEKGEGRSGGRMYEYRYYLEGRGRREARRGAKGKGNAKKRWGGLTEGG